jgi:hypothetical protein
MPQQLGVTIRAMVAADQVADLRKSLTANAPQGLADGPFHFRHLRGLHFAKLFLIEQTDDLEGRLIPASLVLMTEVDAPLRRHLAHRLSRSAVTAAHVTRICAAWHRPLRHLRRQDAGQLEQWQPHYRCTFLDQYAAKNKVDHPTSVYVREEQLLPQIDSWLARKLDPVAFTAAVHEYESQRPEPQPDEDARQEIADCDSKLRQHRAALEAGADPVLITSWMK